MQSPTWKLFFVNKRSIMGCIRWVLLQQHFIEASHRIMNCVAAGPQKSEEQNVYKAGACSSEYKKFYRAEASSISSTQELLKAVANIRRIAGASKGCS